MNGGPVDRVCFTLQVRPDRLEEYRERHRAVWPEMLRALKQHGWHDYSLFLRDDGLLVGIVHTEDFEGARDAMARTEVNDRWQEEMAPFFTDGDEAHADRRMQPLAHVFHLETALADMNEATTDGHSS